MTISSARLYQEVFHLYQEVCPQLRECILFAHPERTRHILHFDLLCNKSGLPGGGGGGVFITYREGGTNGERPVFLMCVLTQ